MSIGAEYQVTLPTQESTDFDQDQEWCEIVVEGEKCVHALHGLDYLATTSPGGASKAAVCRAFRVARSTLLDSLARAGWTGPAAVAANPAQAVRRGAATDRRRGRGSRSRAVLEASSHHNGSSAPGSDQTP